MNDMEIGQVFQQNIYLILFVLLSILLFRNRILAKWYGIQEMSLQDAYEIYKKKSADTIFLDVRTTWELEREPKLKKSKSIPLSDLSRRMEELSAPVDRGRKIIVFCRTSNRARSAAIKMKKAGLSGVYVMNGGITAWSRSNFPVIRPKIKQPIG